MSEHGEVQFSTFLTSIHKHFKNFWQVTKFIEMEVTPSLQKYMDKLKEGGKVELQV